ncbi:hypothetical protein DAI22_12g171300 [Oryza sativa Japonica Group]|nr:hypothetical protein DAI22_12g171300 [Oryza sativa Japonica Group]
MITLCQTKELVPLASGAITGGVIEGFSGVTRLLATAFSTPKSPPTSTEQKAEITADTLAYSSLRKIETDPAETPAETPAKTPAKILFRLLVFTTIVVPLVFVYTLGMYISTAISLFRLTRRDLGFGMANAAADGGANLQKPALRVLYLMALAQGVLYFYGMTFITTGRKMERKVADKYNLNYGAKSPVREYAVETMAGCMKDPSFVRGRNMVTHAIGLIESSSIDTDNFINGVRIIDSLVQSQLQGHHALMRQLLTGSASSSHILVKLLEAATRCSPTQNNMTKSAARIVEYFAVDIHLKKLPGGIECISDMLELSTTGPQLEQFKDTLKLDQCMEMLHWGLKILRILAAHSDNCRVICDTEGLLSRIMAPMSSDLLHRIDHEVWHSVVEESMQLVALLVVAPGVTGVRLRREISGNKEAVTTMDSIPKCSKCKPLLQIMAIKILSQLAFDKSLSMSTSVASREELAKYMLCIFTDDNKDMSVRKSAAQALAMLCVESQSIAVVILQADGNVVGVLKDMLLHSKENESRISAAEILAHLYNHYTYDDEYLGELNKVIKDVMPKVLGEMFGCGDIQTAGTKADKAMFSPPGSVSIEVQDGDNWLRVDSKLLEAFLYLITTVFDVSQDQDLVQLVDVVFPGDATFTPIGKLKEMVCIYILPNYELTAHWLRIVKLIFMMFISMLRLRSSSYAKEEENLKELMGYLSEVSIQMYGVDGVLSLADSNNGAKPPLKTLVSLFIEAQEIVDGQKEGIIYLRGSVEVNPMA